MKVRHLLKTVVIFDGHPSQNASLKPDEFAESEGAERHTWRLSARDEHWIQCGYAGTKVVLAKAIAPGATRCEAVWRGGYREVVEVKCE